MLQPMSTKEQILRKSIHLFADDGYESVSMKTIAHASGIQAASIYNHYKSKEEILQSIFEYYKKHCYGARPTPAEYLPVLQKGSATEILHIFNYPMPDQEDNDPLLFDITRIIMGRMYIDAEAGELYRKYVIEAGLEYIREVIGKGVEMGRLSITGEDLEAFALIVLSSRIFTANAVVADPDQPKWRNTEFALMGMLSKMLYVAPVQG